MVVDAGGGVGAKDDAGGAVAPHQPEDDGGAPSSEAKTYNGDVGLNGVKKALRSHRIAAVWEWVRVMASATP